MEKKEKYYYAIVRSGYLHYKKRIEFPTLDEGLPIYWSKKVAVKVCEEWNLGGKGHARCEIIRVRIVDEFESLATPTK